MGWGVQWGVPPKSGCGLWQDAQGREQEEDFTLGSFSSIFQFVPCPQAPMTALAWLEVCIFKL